jgi:hypothetical protein
MLLHCTLLTAFYMGYWRSTRCTTDKQSRTEKWRRRRKSMVEGGPLVAMRFLGHLCVLRPWACMGTAFTSQMSMHIGACYSVGRMMEGRDITHNNRASALLCKHGRRHHRLARDDQVLVRGVSREFPHLRP